MRRGNQKQILKDGIKYEADLSVQQGKGLRQWWRNQTCENEDKKSPQICGGWHHNMTGWKSWAVYSCLRLVTESEAHSSTSITAKISCIIITHKHVWGDRSWLQTAPVHQCSSKHWQPDTIAPAPLQQHHCISTTVRHHCCNTNSQAPLNWHHCTSTNALAPLHWYYSTNTTASAPQIALLN